MNQQSIHQTLETVDWGPPPPINKHYPGLHREADPWLESVGLADKPGRLEKHQRIEVPLFAAMAYPTASRDNLLLDFEREAHSMARASQGLNDDTKLYIHGLKVWYQANYFWSLKCRRFIVEPVEWRRPV
ncbi:hypothetical protein [Cystobacter fuscus]|uniref:hypothetical protein n=1 Tax=Cystobacter fuscus TaxID=43 RepID=UPI002B306A60|nr:hypothetical protein F0U63_36900 [Cystobacter fuscus]